MLTHSISDWVESLRPRIPWEDTILYELHVRGFTVHPSSGVRHPGTFAGLIEKIPYLKSLGVTAVELLPIHEFDENDCPFVNPVTGETLRNFWGYNTHRLRRPKAAYAASGPEHGQVDEFRDMVRAFHAAGIEVILDVVFNHTGEGDDRGRPITSAAWTTSLYYLLDDARPLPELHRLRQHGQLQPPGRPRPAPRPACVTGSAEHARRRLPLRPGVGPRPRPARATCWSSRRSSR